MSGADVPEPPLEGPLGPVLLKVIRGTPTAEELAVVTLLLTTLAAAGEGPEPGSEPAAAAWDRPVGCSPVSWPALRQGLSGGSARLQGTAPHQRR